MSSLTKTHNSMEFISFQSGDGLESYKVVIWVIDKVLKREEHIRLALLLSEVQDEGIFLDKQVAT